MNLKCPKCGGAVVFDPQSGKMKCKSCEGETSRSDFSSLEGRIDEEMGMLEEDEVFGSMPTYSPKPKTETGGGMPTYSPRKKAEATIEAAVGGGLPTYKVNKAPEPKVEPVIDATEKEIVTTSAGLPTYSAENSTEVGGLPIYSAEKRGEVGEIPTYSVKNSDEVGMKEKEEAIFADTPLFADEDNPVYAADEEYMEMNIYHCSSCGADLMVGGTQASTFCSYCGAPSIVFERVSQEIRPKKIIPFKLTEEQALKCIRDRFEDGGYIPKSIRELSVDKVRAIYIPYWLYSSYIRRKMTIHVTTDDDGSFDYYRDASCKYERVTMDASLKLNNEMSRRLEPFYMNELEDFDVAYLSGFYADTYDVPKDAVASEVQERCAQFLDKHILQTCHHVNYNEQMEKLYGLKNYKKQDVQEEYRVEGIEYALLPAYFVNLKYETGRQLVIVNGQTGKVIGNLPAEKGQIRRRFIKNALISCALNMFVSTLAFLGGGNLLMLLGILLMADGFGVAGGLITYNRYKRGLQRMASANMSSYVNKRGDL